MLFTGTVVKVALTLVGLLSGILKSILPQAPTPIPYTEVISGAASIMTDFGLWGFLIGGLMIGIGAWAFRRIGGRGK